MLGWGTSATAGRTGKMPPLSTMGPLLFLLLGGANAALFMRGGGANRNKRGRQQDHAINVVEQALDAAGAAPRKPSADDAASTHFYDSAVKDHFTTSIATAKEPKWSQRYYVDSTFWKGEGYPVFLYIGGEGPQSAPSSRLFMWTLAEQHGALMISLEHRYYGESWPVPDMTDENLVYLTSEQALSDIARFVTYVNSVDPAAAPDGDANSSPPLVLPASTAASKWVAFGGSYPGNLATWLKLKYPALVEGVVGSSAPVFAEYDFVQYGA
jgi:serine protease 16